ncbi:MAG: signal peptidase I [Bdellovibrionales bacterium]
MEIKKNFENLGREFRDSFLRALRDYSESLMFAIIIALIIRSFVFSSYKIANTSMEPNLKTGDFILGYKLPFGIRLPFSDIHFGYTPPRRGDIVIFKCPKALDTNCIKRVIGLPGDRIEIKNKRLIWNGLVSKYTEPSPSNKKALMLLDSQINLDNILILNEAVPYKSRLRKSYSILIEQDIQSSNPEVIDSSFNFGPIVVPPGHFFALGDNRDFTEDSRVWGAIPFEEIEARPVLVWFSIEWMKSALGEYSSHLRWNRIFTLIR